MKPGTIEEKMQAARKKVLVDFKEGSILDNFTANTLNEIIENVNFVPKNKSGKTDKFAAKIVSGRQISYGNERNDGVPVIVASVDSKYLKKPEKDGLLTINKWRGKTEENIAQTKIVVSEALTDEYKEKFTTSLEEKISEKQIPPSKKTGFFS